MYVNSETDVLLSPILFNNLGFKQNNIKSEEYNNQITIYSLNNHSVPPVATEVTLSRVASPYTNEKRYLDHALNILKDSFTKTKKVVHLDDLIPVIVDGIYINIFIIIKKLLWNIILILNSILYIIDEKVKFNIKEDINNFSSRLVGVQSLFYIFIDYQIKV